MTRWWRLVQERFAPSSYLPMTTAFVLANVAIASGVARVDVGPERVVLMLGLAISFFFRLRLFDELKDHDYDRSANPERPLARGLLDPKEVKRVAFALAMIELALAAGLGPRVLATHALAVGYSALMYREFFVGGWLRPRLTLYAVTHTFVAAFLGYSIATAVAPQAFWKLPLPVLAFGLVNWMLFNVFEFARKTFAPEEERDQVASYTKVFGSAGAGMLTISQILVALAVLATFETDVLGWDLVRSQVAIATLPVAAAVLFGVSKAAKAARMLRTVSNAYVVFFFAVVAAAMLAERG